jgi:CTP synthase (UTP-ammonia lyase)
LNNEVQILELPGHPYYVGVQFHPEFKSRPGKPSAVFLGELEIQIWIFFPTPFALCAMF